MKEIHEWMNKKMNWNESTEKKMKWNGWTGTNVLNWNERTEMKKTEMSELKWKYEWMNEWMNEIE